MKGRSGEKTETQRIDGIQNTLGTTDPTPHMRGVESPIFSPIKIEIFYEFRYGWRKNERKKPFL